jgi:hypothetical protein
MTTQLLILLFIGLVVTAYVAIALAAYVRMRGTRLVTCPETERAASVKVDAAHAALGAMREHAEVKLASCSRWPERKDCAQTCAAQIEVAPKQTLAFEVLKRWYAGKNCAICRRTIPPLEHIGPKPGLLNFASPGHETLSWEEIPAENLPAMLQTHLPVCSHCQVAESFRRQFPDLVVDRSREDEQPRVH